VIATVPAPETLWEHYIPIWGAPQVREMVMATGGDFEVTFPKGFDREGEYSLATRLYAGPTLPVNKMTLPPFPPVATDETTFIVAGEAPPEEIAGFRDFKITSYSKNGGTPVIPLGTLELELGDRCRINLDFEHKGPAVARKFHAAIWTPQPWDPHDEILAAEKSFSVPLATDWEPGEESIDIVITSDINPGTYGLYAKIMGVPGPDIFSQFLENVITITGVPVKGEFRDFGITGWAPTPAVLNIGDSLTITHHFEYKGPRYTTADIHTAIGTRGAFGFDEILAKSVSVEAFGPNEDWMGYDVDVTIPITTAISPGTGYDLYSKLTDIPGADLYDYKDDIIEIVGVPPEEYKGSITKKEFVYNSSTQSIPASDIPTDTRGIVRISGRNDMSTRQKMGISWEIRDPSNRIVETYTDWEDYFTYPGNAQRFIGGRFDLIEGTYTINIGLYMNPDTPTIVDSYNGILCTVVEEAPPVYDPPRITTRPATNITHNSATIWGQLIDTGYWNVVDCRFEWGKTTAYGNKTSKVRMYEGNEGDEIQAELTGLDMDTTYHYRAYAVTVGVNGELKGYGDDRTFTTEKEVVKGFTFRVRNARAGSTSWWAAYVAGGQRAHMPVEQPLSYVWEWRPYPQYIPATKEDFFVTSLDSAGRTTQYDEFRVKLREGKDYIWDFSAHELLEDGVVIIRTA